MAPPTQLNLSPYYSALCLPPSSYLPVPSLLSRDHIPCLSVAEGRGRAAGYRATTLLPLAWLDWGHVPVTFPSPIW